MRVIAGRARGLPLVTVKGDHTRPTTDRIKETLFNILQNDLYGIRFLDLFAGSGGIGIEALSRGAAFGCFIDNDRSAISCIRKNLSFTHLDSQAEVIPADVITGLSRLEGGSPFQVIFMDPPYEKRLEHLVLEYVISHRPSFVDQQTLFIVETTLRADISDLTCLGYRLYRVKEYKTNKHVFLTLRPPEKEQI
ncbi:MAG: 16S rRNA (guanine(966)-N(2))-methyltransferase RsmD [Lachnospiraceae bacterium]|nr:16S rRNA (guanine(966)-N(2))-methyltransferase RsmD [Lachnospiraceae bacterium]